MFECHPAGSDINQGGWPVGVMEPLWTPPLCAVKAFILKWQHQEEEMYVERSRVSRQGSRSHPGTRTFSPLKGTTRCLFYTDNERSKTRLQHFVFFWFGFVFSSSLKPYPSTDFLSSSRTWISSNLNPAQTQRLTKSKLVNFVCFFFFPSPFSKGCQGEWGDQRRLMWMCFLCYHSEWLTSYVGLITHGLLPFFLSDRIHLRSTQLSSGVNSSPTLSSPAGQRSWPLFTPLALCSLDITQVHRKYGNTTAVYFCEKYKKRKAWWDHFLSCLPCMLSTVCSDVTTSVHRSETSYNSHVWRDQIWCFS